MSVAVYYARMAAGLAALQLAPRSKDPIEAIREQLRHRDDNFLSMARYTLSQEGSLYRQLFQMAGCGYPDLEREVKAHGLRATLTRLLEAGVYVTHDEFRGRKEIVRDGSRIPWKPEYWVNPKGRGLNPQATSGSTGQRAVTAVSTKFLRYREGHEALEIEEMGLRRRARVLVGAILPSSWPIRRMITLHRLDVPVDRWFAPEINIEWQYLGATRLLVTQCRLLGARIRMPEFLPPNNFLPVAQALAEFRAQGRPAYVRTMTSMATRIAATAAEHNLNIEGTLFSVSGETLSDAKREVIERAGASAYSFYGATEMGTFGAACASIRSGDGVHLLEDNMMLVTHRLPGMLQAGVFVTNVQPLGPHLLINTGIDDSAVIEERSCDCVYQRLGLTMQAHHIFSVGKITSQGMTINAAQLASLIETELPARFGGHPGDYQLAEIQGREQSEVVLRVRPRAGIATTEDIRAYFLEQLGRLYGGSLSRRLWAFTGGLRVAFEAPEETSTGKVHPVRLQGNLWEEAPKPEAGPPEGQTERIRG